MCIQWDRSFFLQLSGNGSHHKNVFCFISNIVNVISRFLNLGSVFKTLFASGELIWATFE